MHIARSLACVVCLASGVLSAACNDRNTASPDPKATDPATESTTQLPAGHPDIATTTPALPAGHPSIATTMPALPAGHPAIPAEMMDAPTTLPTDGPITWTLPKDWSQQAGTGPRYATLRTPEARRAELAITNFPGDVGGTLPNINRWRAQAGLAAIAVDQLEQNITRLDVNGIKVVVADIAGEKPNGPGMLAAIVPDNDSTWFFKLLGTKETAAKNKDDFMQLVKSIKLQSVKAPQK